MKSAAALAQARSIPAKITPVAPAVGGGSAPPTSPLVTPVPSGWSATPEGQKVVENSHHLMVFALLYLSPSIFFQ